YDFIAVYKTKHMVKMAKSMIESRAILGIVIPKKFIDFKKRLQDVEIGGDKKDCLILGSGDIIFPLILSASLLPQGIVKSGIILIFSIVGLFFGFILFLKLGKKPMPALPPLALSSIIGYAIAIAI
ncbi:MAG: presenilin family intramembrane aspartyl protease, partial [Candidatus Bathyarchaeota archaeon]|nr:presenilin family intramembrane aspartyl protease [Candidatus Bathyarchaeota archaeon]